MAQSIYDEHLERFMNEAYSRINTDLMIVIQSLIGTDVLRTSDLEQRVKSQLEREIGWKFNVSDVGNAANKLYELGVLWRYRREGEHRLGGDFTAQNLYAYGMPKHALESEGVVALAALRVFGDSDASIAELTQRRNSISAIKLLTAMFPHSMLDMGPIDFCQNREKYDRTNYCPTFNELKQKTGLRETSLRRQLEKLEKYELIEKIESPREYNVVEDLTAHKPPSKFGSTNRAIVEMARGGFLSVGSTFDFGTLYKKFTKKPNRKMLSRKLTELLKAGYLIVSKEGEPTYWRLEGKGERIGLYFVLPRQRYLMGYDNLQCLQDEASFLLSHASEKRRYVTNVLARYSQVCGYVGRSKKK